MRKNKKFAIALMALLTTFAMSTAVACGWSDDGSSSTGSSTGTESSTGSSDAGSSDTGSSDTGSSDTGSSDTGSSDTGSSDSGQTPSLGADVEVLDAIPANGLKMSALADGVEAEANWFVTYGDTSLNFSVYVEDATVYTDGGIYGNDSAEMRISKVQNVDGYSAGTISVLVDATGAVKVKNLSTNADVTDSGVTATVKKFSLDGQTVAGWYATVSVPYASTEVTKDAKDAAVCLGITNANDFIAVGGGYDGTYGADETSVRTYMAVTADNTYAENENLRKEIDVLFAGDSYVDFWDNDPTFAGAIAPYDLNAVNLGVGGTKVEYWSNAAKVEELRLEYKPSKIVFHIGVNDVDDSNQTADETIAELQALYSAYHTAFPNAQLYWISHIPNTMFVAKNTIYYNVNQGMKAYDTDNDWFTYIDVWNAFSQEGFNGDNSTEIKPRANMFWDGLHLNIEYGYPLWGSIILETMGYAREHGEVMGDVVGHYAYTSGWDVNPGDGNEAVNMGIGEAPIYYADIAPSADVYFETELRAPAATAQDAYPKVGLILRSDDVTVFGFFDLHVDALTAGNVSIVARANTTEGNIEKTGNWDWNNLAPNAATGKNITQDYVKVGIAKLNDTVYVLIDGKVVTQKTFPSLTADAKVVAGVMGFNMKMEVKNSTGTNVESEVQYKLLTERTVSIANYDNLTYDLNRTTAKQGDTITFKPTYTGVGAIASVSYKYGETTVPLTADNGTYTFTMPDADVSILVTFQGLCSLDVSAVNGKVQTSALTALEGETITVTAANGYAIDKLYADGTLLTPEADGSYVITLNADVVLTGEFFDVVDGIILDGELDNDYGTVSTVANYSDNRTITVNAVKKSTGVFINVVARMNTIKTDSDAWYLNTNFEFYLNDGYQRYLNINGTLFGVSNYKWVTVAPNGADTKYTYKVEIFVAKDLIPGWTDNGNVQLNYAWKTEGETATITNPQDVTHAHVFNANMDWLSWHRYGAAWTGDPGYRVNNLYIGANGLVFGQTAQNATIDGDISEYASLAKLSAVGDAAKATIAVSGKAAADGLYLGLTITHGNWSTWNANDWAANDNIEFRINEKNCNIVFINGELYFSGLFAQGVAVTTEVEGKQVTTVELFMPNTAIAYNVRIGMAGAGFGGWQSPWWDNNDVVVTADGVKTTNDSIASEGVTLDGVMNEEVWTADVKAKEFTTEARNATIRLIGRTVSGGVLLAMTFEHAKNPDTACQGNGMEWWNYLGPEFRVCGNNNEQIAASTFNKSHAWRCRAGYVTTGEGPYTTTFEVFIPCAVAADGRVSLGVAAVVEDGFSALWGTDWGVGNYPFFVTADGIVQA